jgi:hypothetical protein
MHPNGVEDNLAGENLPNRIYSNNQVLEKDPHRAHHKHVLSLESDIAI